MRSIQHTTHKFCMSRKAKAPTMSQSPEPSLALTINPHQGPSPVHKLSPAYSVYLITPHICYIMSYHDPYYIFLVPHPNHISDASQTDSD